MKKTVSIDTKLKKALASTRRAERERKAWLKSLEAERERDPDAWATQIAVNEAIIAEYFS